MATANPFDLLGDDDNDDPSQLIAAQQQKVVLKKTLAPAQPAAKSAKLPSKPSPPAQAVREAKNEGGRGNGRGRGGYGRGRGVPGGYNRDSPANNENSFGNRGYSGGQGAYIEDPNSERSYDRGGSGYGGPHGGRRGGFSNGEDGNGERPRRPYERHSGTGRGADFKRDGAGRGNWGTQADEVAQVTEEVLNEGEKSLGDEKPSGEEDTMEGNKENPSKEPEDKEPEEMTLEEYQKVLEEKRKALLLHKPEERKVGVDKELASMQQLSSKKSNDEIFIKLGSEKDKRKEIADKEEKTKKALSINEFLKPAEGEKFFTPRGRGGRGRGSRGGGFGGSGGGFSPGSGISSAQAPKIEDPGQFPTLGAK